MERTNDPPFSEGNSHHPCDGGPAQYETADERDDDHHIIQTARPISRRELNPCAEAFVPNRFSEHSTSEMGHDTQDRSHPPSQSSNHQYFQVGIPTFSNGLTTFAYQQVLRNRVPEAKLQKHAEYDLEAYTPTFIHDCLMLPGSLANLLEKDSPFDITIRMTPAILPGYRAISACDTGEPYLVPSHDPRHFVQGVLIFGSGKTSRRRLRKHYRPYCRRTKVFVETDVEVSARLERLDLEMEHCRIERRKFKAHAFVRRSGGCSLHYELCPQRPWTLENYLESTDNDGESLRVDPTAYGTEDDGGVSLPPTPNEELSWPPEREVVMAGWGTIQYDRVEGDFSGW